MIPARLAGPLVALLTLAGCGASSNTAIALPSTGAVPLATASAVPVPRSELLVAVLERRGRARTPNLVALVGLDGRAVARASFTERSVPTAGGLTAVLQPEAQVVDGGVYFTDGLGVVRRLSRRGGEPRTVATFPVTSDQQAVSVAISPDGTRLMATVVTLQPWHVDVETAPAGGPTVTVRSIDVAATEPGTAPRMLQVASWDATGPVGLPDGAAAVAEDDSGGLWQGHPAHLDSRGLAGPVLGGPSCGASFEEPDGILLCHDAQAGVTTLRGPDGTVIHRFTRTGSGPRLSPDGERLAYGLAAGGAVQARDGTTVTLAAGFTPSGWLDVGLVIGNTRGGELGYVDLGAPTRVVDMGFAGSFVGVIRGG